MKRFPLLPRKKDSNKHDYGHVLVLAGSRAYPGAAVLTATAALKAGAGLVTLTTARSARAPITKGFPPELMPVFLPETADGSVSERAFEALQKIVRTREIDVAAIGPGLTRHPSTSALVRKLVKTLDIPIVLDADGLNAFKGHAAELKEHRDALVLTPHAGEFERLFGSWPSLKQRIARAKNLAGIYDAVLVLKGHRTVIASRYKAVSNPTGNPGMAKGGAGDVLTGVVAAFLAQGLDPFKAAAWGVYFHGRAGDLAVKRTGQLSLTASDLIEFLPKAFFKK